MRARVMPRHSQFRHCEERSDEAIQYDGAGLDCFASLAMTRQTKKEAERRQTHAVWLHRRMQRALSGARSPVGVPPRHLLQRTNATAQLQIRASWDLVGRTIPMVRKIVRFSTGVTRSFLSQSSEFPRRPVIMPAGRMSPKPPGSGGDEPPPAGTAFAPPAGVTGWRPLRERDSWFVTETGTFVNEKVTPLPVIRGLTRVIHAEVWR